MVDSGLHRPSGSTAEGGSGLRVLKLAGGFADHPATGPPTGIVGLPLGLHPQADTGQHVSPVSEAIALTTLLHQIAVLLHCEQAPRLEHLTHFRPVKQGD